MRAGMKAKKLTAAESRHIEQTTDGTLESFRNNRAEQLKWMAEGSDEPCFECARIARKVWGQEAKEIGR
jgi:hypothetical protein